MCRTTRTRSLSLRRGGRTDLMSSPEWKAFSRRLLRDFTDLTRRDGSHHVHAQSDDPETPGGYCQVPGRNSSWPERAMVEEDDQPLEGLRRSASDRVPAKPSRKQRRILHLEDEDPDED